MGQNSWNSSCQCWNKKSVPLQILHHFFLFVFLFLFCFVFFVITHNSSVNFKLIYFLLWIKGSHQSPNFETFKYSCEIFPFSSCHFPIRKSVFPQILHYSLVSWKITPLYFLGQTLYNLHKRNQFWEFRVLRPKFTKFLSFLKQQRSYYSNFASTFSVMRHNSSILF